MPPEAVEVSHSRSAGTDNHTVEAGADPPRPRCLRVFEISRVGDGGEIAHLAVELPAAWAYAHTHADVLLRKSEEFGWGAEIVGEQQQHLLGFPWYDHVDKMLLDPSCAELPPDLSSGAWDDLEQGWWASILADGADVYIAEANLDDVVDLAHPPTIAQQRPGVVAVDGADVFWNRLPKAVYDRAWDRAINQVLSGLPD
jgi:hypothetical protein